MGSSFFILVWFAFAVVLGSALLSVVLIWLFWQEFWTPSLAGREATRFRAEQNRPQTGERFLSRELLHPFVGYVLNPAADEAAWKETESTKPPVNSFGLISEQNTLPRHDPRAVNVAIFGGSVARFLAHENHDAVREALQSSGAFGDREVRILCCAIGGYKQPQQLMQLTYLHSLGAEFDVVINLDGFNEVALHPAENAMKGICHSFPRAWGNRAATRIDPRLAFLFGQLAFIEEKRAAIWRFLTHRAFRMVPQLYLAMRMYEVRLRRRKSQVVRSIRNLPAPVEGNLNAGLHDAAPVFQQLAELWTRSSLLMHAVCRSTGTLYFHFLQPNQYFPGSKPLNAQEMQTAFKADHPYRPGVIEGYPLLLAAGRMLERQGVAFADLTGLFAQETETVYIDTCCHFNRRGNQAIARAIAEKLVSFVKAEPLG